MDAQVNSHIMLNKLRLLLKRMIRMEIWLDVEKYLEEIHLLYKLNIEVSHQKVILRLKNIQVNLKHNL